MSTKLDHLQSCPDDMASTSLLPATNHNNSLAHKVTFNIDENEKRSKSAFVRDIPSRQKLPTGDSSAPTTIAARLSLAIRRSLRLSPKQRSATTSQSSATTKDEHRGFRFGDDKNVKILFKSNSMSLRCLLVLLICGKSHVIRHMEPLRSFNTCFKWIDKFRFVFYFDLCVNNFWMGEFQNFKFVELKVKKTVLRLLADGSWFLRFEQICSDQFARVVFLLELFPFVFLTFSVENGQCVWNVCK